MNVDMPSEMGGENSQPTPGVFGRAALGSCLAIGYKLHASKMGMPITPDKTRGEILKFGTVKVVRVTVQPGWKWSECIQPHVGGESCQAGHLGTCVQGSMLVTPDDGSEMIVKAVDAYSITPGHDGEVISDEAFIGYEFNNEGKSYAVWDSS